MKWNLASPPTLCPLSSSLSPHFVSSSSSCAPNATSLHQESCTLLPLARPTTGCKQCHRLSPCWQSTSSLDCCANVKSKGGKNPRGASFQQDLSAFGAAAFDVSEIDGLCLALGRSTLQSAPSTAIFGLLPPPVMLLQWRTISQCVPTYTQLPTRAACHKPNTSTPDWPVRSPTVCPRTCITSFGRVAKTSLVGWLGMWQIPTHPGDISSETQILSASFAL